MLWRGTGAECTYAPTVRSTMCLFGRHLQTDICAKSVDECSSSDAGAVTCLIGKKDFDYIFFHKEIEWAPLILIKCLICHGFVANTIWREIVLPQMLEH